MQVLVTRVDTYCDICKSAGKDTHADPEDAIKLVIRNKPMRLDVCGNHKNPRWQDIEANMIPDIDPAAKPNGKPIGRPAGTTGTARRLPYAIGCPVTGCEWASSKSTQSIAMHLMRVHPDISLEDRKTLYTSVCEEHGI